MNAIESQKRETASQWRRFLKFTNLKWLVPHVRNDGTPAVCLTFTNWMLLEPGIVRQYLDARKSMGAVRARQEVKTTLGREWSRLPRLVEMNVLDTFPLDRSQVRAAFELFQVGYHAWRHVAERASTWHWTPDKLIDSGDRAEKDGYDKELALLQEQIKSVPALCDGVQVQKEAA